MKLCLALVGVALGGYFAAIIGLNLLLFGELAFSPIVPTCCAGI